jgi:tartrate dehydrogenase/decarboxylase/D-malate dehydrogenase
MTERRNMSNRIYDIAIIPGDGIGKEVMPEGVRVLEAAASRYGFELRQTWHDFACCGSYVTRVLSSDGLRDAVQR